MSLHLASSSIAQCSSCLRASTLPALLARLVCRMRLPAFALHIARDLMSRVFAAFMTEATERAPPGASRPGLLNMLQQPSRVATDAAQDGAGRGLASVALRAGASSQRAASVDAPTAHRDAVPGGQMGAAAPASGAKTFLEAAKRSLDKAEYLKVRVSRLFTLRFRAAAVNACALTVSGAAEGVQV